MPVNWVDGVTPVNAANLETMEADTQAVADAAQTAMSYHVSLPDPHTGYQKETERAVANGYAPLDAGAKVPLANLPLVAYGTTLPASPVNGQEAILVDSLTAPSYQWCFRYNAGSSHPEKWEFIGGTPLQVFLATAEALVADTAWHTFPTPVALTAPLAGRYDVFGQARFSSTNACRASISFGRGAAAPTLEMASLYGQDYRLAVFDWETSFTAGEVATLQYVFGAVPTTPLGAIKKLSLTPRRVS